MANTDAHKNPFVHHLNVAVNSGIVTDTVTNILSILRRWTADYPEFRLGSETELEAWQNWRSIEMEEARRQIDAKELQDEFEAEDWHPLEAAVWRVEDLPLFDGVRRREPPVLGVAVAKPIEKEWREQASRYLGSGIDVVWLVLQERHALFVADIRFGKIFELNQRLPAHPLLPYLRPAVSDLYRQLRP